MPIAPTFRAGGTKYQYRCITFRPEWDGGVGKVDSGFYQYSVPNLKFAENLNPG
ncbi:hypothetical protein AGMMS49965_25680 [Bacteroidia bacterium]|nr:hypothetical protein AGMMS49965_25680 [Bacteroidia bacterium]